MGCDIYFHVEVCNGGRWTFHDWERQHVIGKHEDGSTKLDYDELFDDPLYVGRNYSLFAILADVRNGVGFAGCDTGNRFNPIAQPKGLPGDVTDDVMKEFVLKVTETGEEDGCCSRVNADRYVKAGHSKWIVPGKLVSHPDWHSASHFSVAELLAFDWQQTNKHRGWVDAWNFEMWRRNGKPSNWSWGVSGGSVEHISNAHMAKLLDSGEIQWDGPEPEDGGGFVRERTYTTSLQRKMQGWPLPEGSVDKSMADKGTQFYTQVEWGETYATSVGDFLTETLPALQLLGKPEDVRIVFWFDN